MGGVWTFGQGRVLALRRDRDQRAARLAILPDRQADLLHEQISLHHLEDLQLAYRELGKTIPMSSVIQQIQNDMSPGMALTNLLIEVRPDAVKGSGMIGDVRTPPRYHDVAYLSVEGIAPPPPKQDHQDQVAMLFDKLSHNPLFEEVTLDYARDGTLNAFLVRRFEIKLKMDLERLTTQDPDTAGKIAAAGGQNGE